MIAFLGLGRMGAPMARRLVEAGHKVTVWNRTPRVVEGAASAASPAEAVAEAELVVTMLSDPAAVLRVMADAVPGLRAGTIVAEMSTIGPGAVAGLRDRLPPGVGLVDAPVLGSVGPARDGTLTVLAGGLPEDLARCREVLEVFGEVREVGGPGAGAAMKLAVMSVLVPAQVLLAEAVAYGGATGVDPGALLDVLGATPLGALAGRIRPVVERGAFERRYGLGLAAKDLALAAHPVQTLAAAAGERLAAAVSSGLGGEDLTAVFGHIGRAVGEAGGAAPRGGVEKVNPASVPATNGLYSHATRSGSLLSVSGQVALDAEGRVLGEDDMTAQSEHVMESLARILADQGCTFDDVTHIRTFLTDMSRLPEYGAVRRRFITGEPPASTTVEVSRLFRPGLLIEVEVTAVVPGGR
ncbi:NAD-binding protein [Planomonospora sp. ID67723]|uniref:NAD(P)-binding domain-containing protein n=1 Tax=Planomonospora sp. ID67723 TaxID=2738134 RepID=UPI0018C3AE1A|nr:NAD(P)-binding domain-containing protein [Planomonospora sp. ID67723]MBG0831195.1 NAD-binding protein [Planomonospora sp. ID67723]